VSIDPQRTVPRDFIGALTELPVGPHSLPELLLALLARFCKQAKLTRRYGSLSRTLRYLQRLCLSIERLAHHASFNKYFPQVTIGGIGLHYRRSMRSKASLIL
jgi:hypothetical protein